MPRTCRNTFHPPAVITLSLNDLWVSEDSPTGLRFIASHQMHEIGWRHCVQCLQQVNKMQIFTQFLATDGKWLILAQYTKEVSIFVVSYLRLNNWYWSYHSLPWGYSKMLCGGTVGKIDGCRTSDGRTADLEFLQRERAVCMIMSDSGASEVMWGPAQMHGTQAHDSWTKE